MATFKICVFKHQLRIKDQKYPVSIRVYWQGKSAYIDTEYYVNIHQINQRKDAFELRDTAIIGELTRRIEKFEKAKLTLGVNIYKYSAKELKNYLENVIKQRDKDGIDFIAYGRTLCDKRKTNGESYDRISTSLNCLEDFSGKIDINEITSSFLKSFDEFLRKERKITRINQFGKQITTTRKPLTDTGISGYMTDIRTVFNAAANEFNDEERGMVRIPFYPFKKYKVPTPDKSENRNLKREDIVSIFEISDAKLQLKRAILAKDVFLLSFMFVGINLKDLYDLKAAECDNERLSYCRSKTKNRRRKTDKAFISVKIEQEAVKYIEKYRDIKGVRVFDFYRRYSTSKNFVSAIDKGLKEVAKACKIERELSSYYARHSWATIARNNCHISKSDVDECLNHVDGNNKMADIYIEKVWTMLDDANRKVLDYIFLPEKSVKNP